MAEQQVPEVGSEHVFRGVNVRVVGTRKIGRGYTVYYSPITRASVEPFEAVRLADWRKGCQ